MKKIFFLLTLIFFLLACTNTRIAHKKELAKAINKETISIYKNSEGNLSFFLEENQEKYQFQAMIPKYNKTLYDQSYIEKSSNLKKEDKKLQILPSKIWEETQVKVFDKIVPKESFKGVLFLIYYYEIVAYRDEKNQMQFSSLQALPQNVLVTDRYDSQKFIESTLLIIQDFTKDSTEDIVFSTSDLEKNQMPFVYYDKKNNRLISLYNSYTDSQNHESISMLLVKNAVGLLNNPVTVMGRLIFYLYNSAYVLTAQNIKIPEGEPPPLNIGSELNLQEFIPKVEKIAKKDVKKGKIDFLIDGESFFYDFTESIKNAEKEILIRTYIFDNDDYSLQLADLLKEKSKKIEVKVLMDEIGSMTAAITNPQTPMPIDYNPPKRIDKYLEKDSSVKARTAKNPWFTTDHNKVMIFDKNIAYMGGMNIGKEYRYEWHDMMVKTEGPIVDTLATDFFAAWAHAGIGGDLSYGIQLLKKVKDYGTTLKEDYIDILPIYTKTGRTEILKVTLEAIKRSKKEIFIENAYFGDDQVVQALIDARARGVNVKIILPYWGNHDIMNSNNMVKANKLIEAGIKVYLYPKMNHVKASIFDGFAMVGTANYDKLSMRVNQEINFCFWDKTTVEKLKKDLFEKDFKESMLLSGEFPILWVDYLLEKVAKQL